MGKSPGKWIKTILFGKKHSNTNSKASDHYKTSASKTPTDDLSANSSVISGPCQVTDRGVKPLELDPVANQIVVDQESNNSSDAETMRQKQAATVAQAAFRGYLARRAFRALKGIIRLQALIRGHLVRRQAVATLRCMQAIVRLQAKARGQKVNIGLYSSSRSQKHAKHAFARKLLAKIPTEMPLSLQYEVVEPNSAWHWLERWTVFHFWEQQTQLRKVTKVKPQKKAEVVEHVIGKSRRTFRKGSTVVNGENGALASSEIEKPKNNPRKVASNLTEQVQELAPSELERVKRSLRKITASASEASEKTETEPPPLSPVLAVVQSVELVMNSDVPMQEVAISSENPVDMDVVKKVDPLESPLDEPVDAALDNHPVVVDTLPLENGTKVETSPTLDDEPVTSKEEKIRKENYNKVRKKRSFPPKQESSEKASQNSPSMPSYMAATESAKAKLRASGSPKIVEDGAEQVSTRRHSLPASMNGKLSLSSPKFPKNNPQANGKGSNKSRKPSMSSRDDKAGHPSWRR